MRYLALIPACTSVCSSLEGAALGIIILHMLLLGLLTVTYAKVAVAVDSRGALVNYTVGADQVSIGTIDGTILSCSEFQVRMFWNVCMNLCTYA